ncbi:sensor histidine kinase [Planomonospora algeriensis]
MSFLTSPAVRRGASLLLAAYLLFTAVDAVADAAARLGWAGFAAALPAAAFACLPCLWVLLRGHERRSNAALLALSVLGGLCLHLVAPYEGMEFLYFVIYAAPFRTGIRSAVALVLLDAAGFAGVALLGGIQAPAVIANLLGLTYSAVFVFLVRQLLVTRLRTAELVEARAGEAVLAERTRLAREIHDVLAHSQSAQILHLEGARLLLERGGDPAEALDRVNRAVRLARTGLEETRRALDALRGPELPLAERLERLAVEFRSVTGTGCAVSVTGDLEPLEAQARLAVARTAQEALTNVRKHAPGASVSVALRRRGDWCELEVRDTGGARGGLSPAGGGYGLMGMRERAELIGGSLKTGPSGDGFGVLLRIPVSA